MPESQLLLPRLRSIQCRLLPVASQRCSPMLLRRTRGSDVQGYEKDRREENRGKKGDGTRYGGRYDTGKLEIFIAASFPFYAESRDRGRFHSTRLNAIRHRDVIMGRYFKRDRTMESNSRESSGRVLTKAIIERKINISDLHIVCNGIGDTSVFYLVS